MSAAAAPRLEHHCYDCKRVREVETRYEHKALLLCDDCAGRRGKLKPVESSRRRETAASPAAVSPEVLVLPTGTSTLSEEPSPSSLVPCAKGTQEPEVEQLLALHAKDELALASAGLPDLPPTATAAMRQVAEFYALVRALRMWAGDDRPVPFACGWVGQKTGIPKRTVARALRQLVDAEVLELVGAMPGRGARGTHLYEPGAAS
jgi:hypothetical protein